jgi:hypothetical protein
VLSDPEQRAPFDARSLAFRQHRYQVLSRSDEKNATASEKRKRQMLLSLLCRQRLKDRDHPYLTIHELEDLLGYPRDHLQVILWLLKEKGYQTRSDNGRYTISADGFEHAEGEGLSAPSERKLLTAR